MKLTYAVVDIRRKKNGNLVAMMVYGMESKSEAHDRARAIRKTGIIPKGQSRKVHVRKITL